MGKLSSCCLCLLVCGATGAPSSDLWTPPLWVSQFSAFENCAYMTSEPGDPLYEDTTFFTSLNSTFSVSTTESELMLQVTSTEAFRGNFMWPEGMLELVPGYYGNLTGQSSPSGSIQWSTESWFFDIFMDGLGWMAIDSVQYTSGNISALSLRFMYQFDTYNPPPLYGFISWNKAYIALPPWPTPPPSGLWEPRSIPSTGNYVYLESQTGDVLGGGLNYTYLSSDAQIIFTPIDRTFQYSAQLSVQVNGLTPTSGYFGLPSGHNQLEQGYYILPTPLNYAASSLIWLGPVGYCGLFDPKGWYVIDEVSYEELQLNAVRMRFEVRCYGDSAALHGALNWAVNNPLNPPGPVYPPPANLWKPPKASIPAVGNYLYLEGPIEVFPYYPLNHTYTSNNSSFSVAWTPYLHSMVLNFTFAQLWLQPTYVMNSLEKGYYANVRSLDSKPAFGCVYLEYLNCSNSNISGWIAVDSVAYEATVEVTELTARFEVACANGPVLHGAVGWKANNQTGPQPVYPPPRDLWQPPAHVLPHSQNYCYLQMEAPGWARNYTFAYSYTNFTMTYSQNSLAVTINSYYEFWHGYFRGCSGLKELKLGYYGGIVENDSELLGIIFVDNFFTTNWKCQLGSNTC